MLKDLRERHLGGRTGGQVAVCSAHPQVLAAAAARAAADGTLLLVEATANQVNLSGGYTGLTPAAFADQVKRLAADAGLPDIRLLLGADHLGPHPWQRLPAGQAMSQAETLARAFVAAGYRKLHLDTSWPCADDPGPRLPLENAARRAARLCRAAESAAKELRCEPPLYVVGTEVPAPGGTLDGDVPLAVSDPQSLADELTAYAQAFRRAGVEAAWERIIAIVVQPGVDFDDHRAAVYHPPAAVRLSGFHARLPGAMTFEVHAADYQPRSAVAQMARDHFILLKIGPCLTNALREAYFALAQIEAELPGLARPSDLPAVMERLMNACPDHWRSHYHGSAETLRYLRRYGMRDRIRYYWPLDEARRACERLTANLQRSIPAPLLRQFFPDLFEAIAAGELASTPGALVRARIQSALAPYVEALAVIAG